eukprot:3729520-Lingulodinium_polyedra.AAC.1
MSKGRELHIEVRGKKADKEVLFEAIVAISFKALQRLSSDPQFHHQGHRPASVALWSVALLRGPAPLVADHRC